MTESEDIIADFFAQVRMILGAQALPEPEARKIEQNLRCTWGGQPIYVRKLESGSRAATVRAEFNGRNRAELQQKYGISKAQFYKYLKGE